MSPVPSSDLNCLSGAWKSSLQLVHEPRGTTRYRLGVDAKHRAVENEINRCGLVPTDPGQPIRRYTQSL